MRTFRVATLNIWSRFGPWEERLVAIRHGIRELAPDVLGMQEVLRNSAMDQAALVSDGLRLRDRVGDLVGEPRLPDRERDPLALADRAKRGHSSSPNGGSDEQRSIVFAELASPFGKSAGILHAPQLEASSRAHPPAPGEDAHRSGRSSRADRRVPAPRDGRFQRRARLRRDPLHARPHRPGRTLRVLCRQLRRRRRRLAGHDVLEAEPVCRAAARARAAHRLRFRTGSRRFAARRADGGIASASISAHEGTFPSDHFGVIATITAGR